MSRANLLNDLMARVGEIGGRMLSVNEAHQYRSIGDLCAELLSHRGEATGAAIGGKILDGFEALDRDGKRAFFNEVRDRFGVDIAALQNSLQTWQKTGDENDARALHFAIEPKSQELVRRLNRVSSGTGRLISMRKALLAELRDNRNLKQLDDDFSHLLGSWFNRGFLELHRIDWGTSAEILEKIIAYEAVHEINGWDDLRRRVAAPDRRLYAFFHPSLRNEPLIFVEVALVDTIPGAIGPILADGGEPVDPRLAKTAVFYSISNCQAGLRGISFGNFLIKQVVEELRREFSNLDTFATLSPVPGVRRWALDAVKDNADSLLGTAERELIDGLETGAILPAGPKVQPELAHLVAKYLVHAKAPHGGPVDPVARFHLGNGACLERINPAADLSAKGLSTSWGVMVNYLYDLKSIERNHEAFANGGDVICSSNVKRIADRN